ncbi:MAG: DUF885 domain-containing protein [Lachnospiraceae bacterium]|nr:DUF885 domain-containing protein [Lachnospiraceae bacterium]
MRFLSKIHNFFSGKKLFSMLLLCFLLFSAGFLSFFIYRNAPSFLADVSYNKLCREIFRDELSGNTLTLHYTLRNPADYGIYDDEPHLPAYSAENRALSNAAVTEWLEQLSAIDPEQLSEKNRYSYTLLSRYLTLQQSLSAYTCYNEPLSPNSGMQQTLPVLFAEYRFDRRKDIDNYLSLLSQTGSYFVGLLAYEQEKADAGLFMSENSAAVLAKECEAFLTEDAIDSGSHFLVDSFSSRLTEFQKTYPELLSDELFDIYYQENIRILKEDVMPAYQMIAEEMTHLSETAVRKDLPRNSSAFTEKQRYYTLLVQKDTGSYRSITELQEMLYEQFDALRLELINLKTQEADTQATAKHTHPLSVENILTFLQEDMKEDFPPLLSGTADESKSLIKRQLPPISCDIKYISESLSATSAPAFYLTPQMDAFHKNVIYINPASSLEGVSLYTTLAHEGFPGHLYQTVYARESGIADTKNPLRGILDYPGYAEGWALYVELLSYDYAGNYYAADTNLQKTARSMELCLCALLDLHIHYYGLTLSQTQVLLGQFGISKDAAQNIYSYIAQEPANYLKYYVSYLEILSLKQDAMQLWKEDYSDYRFHQFYLDAGPSDFLSLKERLQENR